MTTKWGGFVPDVDGFDADFFGITPREAVAMDPQHRMLLEVAWEALEHAGIPPDSLSGTRTGVMMGLSSWDYTIVNIERRADIDAYLSTGTPHCAAVGRISYLLGLRGPAVAVDTACSSSLVAIHLACQSLRLRESDVALAGGVQPDPVTVHRHRVVQVVRPVADGAVQDLRRHGRRIRARRGLRSRGAQTAGRRGPRRGSGAGGGPRFGDQPGRPVQRHDRAERAGAARRDHRRAAAWPTSTADSVNYVETHGTGTVLGDPIEFEALAATYGRGDGPCALGSVKTNIGHLEAAAGVAGFIKAVLAVERGYIPPQFALHPVEPGHRPVGDPAVRADRERPVADGGGSAPGSGVVVRPQWDQCARGDRAGAGAGPAGGAGAAEHRSLDVGGVGQDAAAGGLDGRGVGRLDVRAPAREAPLADVAHTLNHHRARHAKFATVVARDRAEAVAGLRALAAGQPRAGVVGCHQMPRGPGRVFVYSGQGSQWAGMGRQLLADEPAFAKAVAELEPIFVAQTGFSLQQTLADGDEVVGIERHPAGAGGDAVGADRAVALLRRDARCGDRALDGRGVRRGGGRRADARRRACG